MKNLPFGARPCPPAPDNIEVLDSIMIEPRKSGTLNGGQWSNISPPPKIRLNVYATNESRVKSEEINLGSKENYTMTYRINNHNDSPAFARFYHNTI